MIRFFLYLLLFGVVLYLLSIWGRRQQERTVSAPPVTKSRSLLKAKSNPHEVWIQVYETEALDEARRLQARIQEEEVSCIIYEQGKKDIHGNALRGIGVAVPKTATRLAQAIISRMSS